jgi:hypothetical protein
MKSNEKDDEKMHTHQEEEFLFKSSKSITKDNYNILLG